MSPKRTTNLQKEQLPAISAQSPSIRGIYPQFGLLFYVFRQRRSGNLGTFRDRTEGQEMQVVSRQEYI